MDPFLHVPSPVPGSISELHSTAGLPSAGASEQAPNTAWLQFPTAGTQPPPPGQAGNPGPHACASLVEHVPSRHFFPVTESNWPPLLKQFSARTQSTGGWPSIEALVSPFAHAALHDLKASSPLVPVQSLEPVVTLQFRAAAVRCRTSCSLLSPVGAAHSASSAESASLTILGQLKLLPVLEQSVELEWLPVGTMTSPQMFRQPPPARIAAEAMLRLRGCVGSNRACAAQKLGPRQTSLPGVAVGTGVLVGVGVCVGGAAGVEVGVRVAVDVLVGVFVGMLVGV